MTSEPELMDVDNEQTQGNGPKGQKGPKLTRGEKSKIAAQMRRDKENVAFHSLISELPLSNEVLNKMDKASVVKLAICYIKLKHFIQKDEHNCRTQYIPKENGSILHSLKSPTSPDNPDLDSTLTEIQDVEGQMMLDALNGFMVFVNKKHTIRFVSASVTDHLGIAVESLIGKNVDEIIHPCDIAELGKQFAQEGTQEQNSKRKAITDKSCRVSVEDKSQKVFYLRMKYMSKSGSKTKHSGFMLVQWSGKLKQHISSKTNTLVTDGLVCICRPMQTSSVMEIRMDGNMFMSRHDLGMTFTFCDTRILTLIGYEPTEVVGRTAYHFHNPIDAPKVSDCHQNLIIKGTSVSKYYRFLGKNDNWVWLQTRATIIYNTASKPQYIVCMNYVISEEEGERYLMLEEHKQANHQDDNAVVTLPDNHHPTVVFHTPIKSCPGPTIVELEEKNLERTACLNGELDNPHPTNSTCSQNGRSNVTRQIPEKFPSVFECQKNQQNGFYTHREGGQVQNVEQVYSDTSQGSSLLQQSITQEIGVCKDLKPFQDQSSGVSSNIMTPNQHGLGLEELPAKGLGEDAVDRTLNNLFPNSCHSNSEDAGYESESSLASSSHLSPQVVSQMESEGGYIEIDSEPAPMMVSSVPVPCNPIIENCNFGVPYSGEYEQTMPILDEKATDIPDADNTFLDEILQSLQPSVNLEDNMAAVFTTIESLTQQHYQTLASTVKNPDTPPVDKQQVVDSTTCVKDQPKSDKSFLRDILTMPVNKIPKKPVSIATPVSEGDTTTAKGSPVCRESNSKSFSKNGTCGKPQRQCMTSGEFISSMIQKSLMQKTNDEQNGGQRNLCQGQCQDIGQCEGQITQLPDDISDFALQYMETDMDSEPGADFADISNSIPMDTSESELTKVMLSELEHQCQAQLNNKTQTNNSNRSLNKNGQFQYNTGQNVTFKENNPGLVPPNNFNFHCHGNPSTSSHDHLYVQLSTRSHSKPASVTCHSDCIKGSVSYADCQTQTSDQPISELQKHLLCATPAGLNKSPSGESSSSLLQRLLTGELKGDTYMQMEQTRCPRRQVLKPN